MRDCGITKTARVDGTAQAPAKISLPIVILTADCSATIAKNRILNAYVDSICRDLPIGAFRFDMSAVRGTETEISVAL